ncbi:uncharacterized protein At4g14100 [Ziziphus jujuba]|uniref:Uncharacterized protein At4g14100 n=2 Tax=Ziziphus jujuba TaxID=326968 RepID=A0A6P4BGN8_ZIZJJ|nr:uncharacterized protein At4g14100 [Ziziphus jujuba]KAH7516822.1 hypothetical protein FEM48_Zijuj10G0175600 [Ziziphus jujuba var. spinosa]
MTTRPLKTLSLNFESKATMALAFSYSKYLIVCFLWLSMATATLAVSSEDPVPTPWPHQFHSILVMNKSGILQVIDLWYDWPNGRNFNIIQHQLGKLLYDLEWNNGTSFFYTLDSNRECRSAQLEVGILRPNWLDGANYLGQRHVDGFLCNVWEKVDFIWYYEDVLTKRPVSWVFYTGREAHVMTFEVGAVLEDSKWQVPAYCFDDDNKPLLQSQAFSIPTTPPHHQLFPHDGVLRGSMAI